MSQEFEETVREDRRGSAWGLLGAAALLGVAAATLILVNRTRSSASRHWGVDDLIDAADRAADNLERALMGDQVRVG
jgi:hypothetical protein